MKSILKSLVVVLGLFCIIIGFRLLLNNYNNQIINNAPIYCDNRDYVMALFFPRWDAIQLKYDPTWEKVYIPRFHKFISDNPGFHLYKKSNIPKVLTKEYVTTIGQPIIINISEYELNENTCIKVKVKDENGDTVEYVDIDDTYDCFKFKTIIKRWKKQ